MALYPAATQFLNSQFSYLHRKLGALLMECKQRIAITQQKPNCIYCLIRGWCHDQGSCVQALIVYVHPACINALWKSHILNFVQVWLNLHASVSSILTRENLHFHELYLKVWFAYPPNETHVTSVHLRMLILAELIINPWNVSINWFG